MTEQSTQDKLQNRSSQINNLVDASLGKALIQEVELCQEYFHIFKSRYLKYAKNSSLNAQQKSITGFLYESIDASTDIIKHLLEYSANSNGNVFYQELEKLNKECFQLLNIPVDEKKEINATPGKMADKTADWLRQTQQGLFKKKPVNEKEIECYQYNQLIVSVIQKKINEFDKLEKSRIKLLLNLWDKSKFIDNNISILSKQNFDFDTATDQIILEVDFSDSENLMNSVSQEANEIISSIQTSISLASHSLEKDHLIHAEIIAKNKEKFTVVQTIRASHLLEKHARSKRQKWYNTLLALSDDWSLEVEISSLKYSILRGYYEFIHHANNKLTKPLDEKINSIKDSTEQLMTLFKPADNSSSEQVIESIHRSKLDFRRKMLLRVIPDVKNILLEGDLPNYVDAFEKNSTKQFEALSKSKYLIKNPVYDRPIDRSEMYKISPYDLVSYDMQPEFMEVFPSLKNALIRQLQLLQERLDEIPEIVDYSIESAIGYHEDKEDLSEALKIGSEGIKRASNKIDDLTTLRKDFYRREVDFMKDKIDRLFNDISEITDNENALQIKIRVTKAKAIEQSKAVRDRIVGNIKNFIPKILDQILTFHKFIVESSIKIRKQFEGDVSKGIIESEVSDYLVETEEAINRLPFIYQRLFKLEPLSTFDLYIDRTDASDKFKLAYSKWQSGKFAPTIISGEKGSGKTSFINRFLASKNITEKVIFHDLHREYLEPENAYSKIFDSIKEVISNDKNEVLDDPKKIVVIDGLEKLFEARINGFGVLQKTIQLISKTNDRIFWIVACHLYSFKYLEKAFNVTEFFGYHIELEDLSAKELVNIIEKRHGISGFRLMFLPGNQKKSILPLIKQSDKNDQLELREYYFERLQKIVKGNITQAFLYWMRSAAEVTDDLIYINAKGNTKFDFIRSISLSKFEILKNILIHNGINSNKHSEIFRIPFEKSELQLEQMYDDGIIIKQSEFYNINPMIYKQVIDHMYKLNLLH